MPRLRYSLAEAAAEAKRLAMEYVEGTSQWPAAEFRRVAPSERFPKSPSSKHPVVWFAIFDLPGPDGGVVDGFDLILEINVETKDVRHFEHP